MRRGRKFERHKITKFKSLQIALKELEPFFRNIDMARVRKASNRASAPAKPKPILENGRPLKKFGNMLPRELIINWLFAALGNFIVGSDRFEFTTDPRGGDGVIYDTVSQTALWTEHIMVRAPTRPDAHDAQTRILHAVRQKNAKGGAAYAGGKSLLVFLYSGDDSLWWPNKVAAALPRPLHFDAVWVIAFQRFHQGGLVYALTRLDLRRGNAPAWWVAIAPDFKSWVVSERPPTAQTAA